MVFPLSGFFAGSLSGFARACVRALWSPRTTAVTVSIACARAGRSSLSHCGKETRKRGPG